MGKKLVSAYVLVAIVGAATLAQGAGFKINEQGAKAMGMANAFTAQADDPSALYYNPAGIAYLKGAQVNLGSLVIAVPQTEFTGTTPLSGNPPTGVGSTPVFEKAKRDLFIAPSLYATYSLENLPLTFGLGINSIYPLAKSWDDSSTFRNQIQNIAIKPINFQPTVAYLFNDLNLAVAAGIDVTHAIVSLQKMPYSPDPTVPNSAYELGALGLDGTATDVGYNFALKWKPCHNLSFGLAYRSEITLHIDGDANFIPTTGSGFNLIGMTTAATSPYSRTRITSSASTTLTLPDSLSIGVAWQPTEKLTLEFDAERTGWSSFDKLQFNFNSAQFAGFNNKPDAKNWNDVWAYKVGGQYAYSKNIDLRAGYAYDESPIPDSTLGPELPDSDRHNVALGLGLHNSYASLDLAYMWVKFMERTVNNQNMQTLKGENGTFNSDAHLFGANITIKF
ncbi:OmpP1/FadL family transporter [Geobacter argillaceus]|uniref:Long-chain fatty acid transport protein n=1 Tax=Geobacter argillaceus TaxID=345631 RepID=A0A562VPJ3_9BACT|nr:outer membrane protein transport protein [Geobacter argillaceus]TWJ19849.1 long-chain fatty acid transport protein [Geobacter argillaceus]